MPLQQMLARVRLELPSNIRWTVLRVCLHEQVYVVVLQTSEIRLEYKADSSI